MFLEEIYFGSIRLFRLNAIFAAGHAARHDPQCEVDF